MSERALDSNYAIAEHYVTLLEQNPNLCAKPNPVHTSYYRYSDGRWELARREGQNPHNRIQASIEEDRDAIIDFFTGRTVELLLCEEAGYSRVEKSVWELAEEQDAFNPEVERCSWCGVSERKTPLAGTFKTTDDEHVTLCPSCHSTYESQNLLVAEVPTA